MNERRPPAFSGAAITAITLGAVGLLLVIVWFGIGKVLGAVLGIAALIVGTLAALNARRSSASPMAPLVGAALGAAAVLWLIVYSAIT